MENITVFCWIIAPLIKRIIVNSELRLNTTETEHLLTKRGRVCVCVGLRKKWHVPNIQIIKKT